MSDVTRLLDAVERGEPQAAEELLPLVYEELRRLAHIKMAQLAPGQTLQPTALVHEVFLRLVGSPTGRWQNSRHFFHAAAEAMRHILVDRARRKQAAKHGAGAEHVDIAKIDVAIDSDDTTLLLVNDALEQLAEADAEAAEFVRLRFFVGLAHDEIAQVLGLSERSARRLWAFARAWLYRHLNREHSGTTSGS